MRLAWGVAGSVLVHGLLIAQAGRQAPPADPGREQRLVVRLVPPRTDRPESGQATAAPASRSQRIALDRPARLEPAPAAAVERPHRPNPPTVQPASLPATPVEPAPVQPANAPPVFAANADRNPAAIDGAAFGLPRLGFGGIAPARWARRSEPRPQPETGPPPRPMPDLARIAQVRALEAARGQIVTGIERQLAERSSGSADGACALQAEGENPLQCDSEPLLQTVAAQAATLSALLGAYRSLDPHVGSLQIAYTQGQYHVRLGADGDPR